MKNSERKVTDTDPTVNSNAPQARMQQPQDAHLAWLPKEVLQKEIGQYLSYEDKYYLSRECHGLYTLFKQPASQHVHQFLTHVVRGEKNEVKAYLDKNPELLLEKIQVTDEAGRKIFGTAFQIALGAKDVSPFPDKFNEMAEMIASYFEKIPDGEKEKQKQYDEQFPEGFEKLEATRRARDSEALNTVFAAIKDKTLAEAEVAVTTFQDYLKKQTEGVIKTGYHFNEALFQQALTLYINNFDACGGHYNDKNNLAAVKVLGDIQYYFTANLAQAACDGFGNVVDEKKVLSRSKLLADDVTYFFNSKLGVGHFVYSYKWHGCGRGLGTTPTTIAVSNLMSNKNNWLGKLMQPHSRAQKPRCVIS